MKRLAGLAAVLLLFLFAAVAFAACGDDEETTGTERTPAPTTPQPDGDGDGDGGEPIKVGAVMSVAGVFAGFAQAELNALELAIEEINANGGIMGRQVQLVFYDDEGDQSKSIQLTNRLINNDRVVAIFGPNITPTAEVVAPIVEDAGIPMIGFVAQAYLWEGTDHIFMTWPAQTMNARAMVEYSQRCEGAQRAAILYTDVPYGHEGNTFLKEHIEDLGLDLVYEDRFEEGGFEFTPQVRSAVNAEPDVVFLWGSGATSDGTMFKQLREAGFQGPIVMDLVGGSPQIADIATPELAEGLVTFSLLDYANPDELAQHFIEAYSAKFGDGPPPYASIPYDAPYFYKAAVEKAGSTEPAEVAAVMFGLDLQRVTGRYQISEEDHVGLGVEAFKPLMFESGDFATLDCPLG